MSCRLLVLLYYTGEVPPHVLTLFPWNHHWLTVLRHDVGGKGEEGHSLAPSMAKLFFFFFLELFTSSLYSLKEQRMVSWPLILSRSFGQKGPVHGNIIVAHTEKDRNRGHTRASKFPFRPLHAISFPFLNICSSFLSSTIKVIHEAVAFQTMFHNAFWAQCCFHLS